MVLVHFTIYICTREMPQRSMKYTRDKRPSGIRVSRYECTRPLKYHPSESLDNKQLAIFIRYLTPRVAVSVTKLTLSAQSNPIPLEDASRDVHLR